jgi:ATP-dependent phosphofructokinase / diphosphate-dependent phosphofructokinase
LQEGVPTFGYHSAKEAGVGITLTIAEDARTNGTWFVLSAMGREAGHLAFGIGMATHAPMVIVPEMFSKTVCTFDKIVNLMVSTILKRTLLGIDYGVIIVSEGVFHFLSDDEIKNCGIQFTYDDHGHPELGTVSKGQIFDTLLQRKLKELGIKVKSRPNDMGYELRCVRPIAFDLAYCSAMGTGVFKLFSEGKSGCMVTLNKDQHIVPLFLKDLEDPKTGKIKPRLLNMQSDRVKQYFGNIAHYITKADYEAAKKLVAKPEDFDFDKILG